MPTRRELLLQFAKETSKNIQGRNIVTGVRGGEYIVIDGKRVYKFVARTGLNKSGRKVMTGPRGGKYVMSGSRKIYIK
jgi:hypothetical protein